MKKQEQPAFDRLGQQQRPQKKRRFELKPFEASCATHRRLV
jgi:hypothetical protein